MTPDMPMPPDEFAKHVARREAAPRPDPLHDIEPREPATETSPLAAELLAEARDRSLETGELLLISEEATLEDLEAAAARAPLAEGLPEVPDGDPMLAALVEPRLLNPRVWEVMGWEPPLAEHLRLIGAAVQSGLHLPQVMLVGHVETFPERVEHLARLRDLIASAGSPDGVTLAVRQAEPGEIDNRSTRIDEVMEGARPAASDADRRHAVAMARLILGAGRVVSG